MKINVFNTLKLQLISNFFTIIVHCTLKFFSHFYPQTKHFYSTKTEKDNTTKVEEKDNQATGTDKDGTTSKDNEKDETIDKNKDEKDNQTSGTDKDETTSKDNEKDETEKANNP